jgi:hypothetical protein
MSDIPFLIATLGQNQANYQDALRDLAHAEGNLTKMIDTKNFEGVRSACNIYEKLFERVKNINDTVNDSITQLRLARQKVAKTYRM